jgi:hypothetical protein
MEKKHDRRDKAILSGIRRHGFGDRTGAVLSSWILNQRGM